MDAITAEKPRILGKIRRDRGKKEVLQPTQLKELRAFYVNGAPVRFFADTPQGQLVLFTDDEPDAMVAMATAIGLEKKVNPAVNFANGYFFLGADLPVEIKDSALARGFDCEHGDLIGFAVLSFDSNRCAFTYTWLEAKTEKAARKEMKGL